MNLRELAIAIKALKVATAGATDGVIIGVDTVSGGPYTGDLVAVGSILNINGKMKVVVDGIAYGDHNGDSGRFYPGTNRLVLIAFDPETLELTGPRTNAAFASVNGAKNLGMIFDYVLAREAEIAAQEAAAKAAEELAARQAKAKTTRKAMRNF